LAAKGVIDCVHIYEGTFWYDRILNRPRLAVSHHWKWSFFRSLAAASLIIHESRGRMVDLYKDDFKSLSGSQRHTIYPPASFATKGSLSAPSMPVLLPTSSFNVISSKQILVGNFQLVNKIGKLLKGANGPTLVDSDEDSSEVGDLEKSTTTSSRGGSATMMSGSLDDNEDSLLRSTAEESSSPAEHSVLTGSS